MVQFSLGTRDFFLIECVHRDYGAHPVSNLIGAGGYFSGRGLKLSTKLHIENGLRICGTITPLSTHLVACTRTT